MAYHACMRNNMRRNDRVLTQNLVSFLSDNPELVQKGMTTVGTLIPVPGSMTVDMLFTDRKNGRVCLAMVKTDRKSSTVQTGKKQLVSYKRAILSLLSRLGIEPPQISLIEIAYTGKKTYIFSTDDEWEDGDNERTSMEIGRMFREWMHTEISSG